MMAVEAGPRTAMDGIAPEALEAFAAGVRGVILHPGDARYDEARVIQNGMIDRRPGMIVQCRGTADVIAAVNFAREQNLLLSVKGGAHNVAGNCINEGGLVIDLSTMNGVHVDPAARVAHVQGGATWNDFDGEAQLHGLAAPGGVVSTTGVAGLTLHGGMGHLRGKYGLSLDNLRSVQIVTADGQLRTASKTEHPDLFWAIRGAGPNFGVVTSFEFELHPVGPIVQLCAVMYHLDDAPSVLRKWRDFMANAPDEFSPIALFWSVPEGFPPELVGTPVIIIAGIYVGPVQEGANFIQPLRELATPVLDMSDALPFTGIQSAFDPFFPRGIRYYWKSTYVDEFPDEMIDVLCELAANRPSPKTTMDIWPLHGAVQRIAPGEMAFGPRKQFMVAFESTWLDPADDEANIAWARTATDSMKRFNSAGAYLNFPGFGEEKEQMLRAAYGDANYERLVELKTQYDPTNLFRMNQNIPPRVS